MYIGCIVNPIGKRAHYYMSIMKEAHSKLRNNGESDKSFKRRFTTEPSRQFDILQAKEAISVLGARGWSFRKPESEFSIPGYQWACLKAGRRICPQF